MNRVKIVVVSTDPHHKNQKLQKQTAKKWGYDYTSIGQNVKWHGFPTIFELVIDYCARQLEDASSSENILYAVVDAYDLVFSGPPEELLEKYTSMNAPIVVGAERICFGNCVPSSCMNDETRLYNNEGCVMGSARDLLEAYQWGLENYPADDQIAMTKFRDLDCDRVRLDTDAQIVLNLEAFTWRQSDPLTPTVDGRLTLSNTKITPCIIHCPNIVIDFGERWNYVLTHVLPGYTPSETKGRQFHALLKHVTKLIKTNKSYFVFTLTSCYFIVLVLIALIVGLVFGFNSFKHFINTYETGSN